MDPKPKRPWWRRAAVRAALYAVVVAAVAADGLFTGLRHPWTVVALVTTWGGVNAALGTAGVSRRRTAVVVARSMLAAAVVSMILLRFADRI